MSGAGKIRAAGPKRELHLICGTHWDREWRYNYEQSLIRLAELVDRAVEILEANPDLRAYHLDGGTVMLEDYARVRPEMVDRVRKLARAGRLVTSPWYTLPEMFTVSGESIVRNIAAGLRTAREYGAEMRVGYTATGYGQISQLPQIYAGFGIGEVLFYRGLNRHAAPQLFWWESPDGTRALDFRLFDDFARSNFYFRVYRRLLAGREPGQNRHAEQPGRLFHPCAELARLDEYRLLDARPCAYDRSALAAAVEDLCRDAAQNSPVPGHFLAMHQEDNAVPSEHLLRLVREIPQACPGTSVRTGTLAEYVRLVRRALGAARLARLPVLHGEMRHCDIDGFWGGLFAAAVSARVDLKLANEAAENSLERLAEPLCALAMAGGLPWPEERMDAAWKALLENHAHDSINGCSMDQVHRDMAYRFDKARLIGRELATRALAHLSGSMGHPAAAPGDHLVGVFNATGWERDAVVTCCLDLPADGPTMRFELLDGSGRPADVQSVRIGAVRGRVHSPVVAGLRFEAVRHRVSFLARSLPAMGWRTYLLRPVATVPLYEDRPRDFRTQLCGPAAMENEHLRVEMRSDGSFDLTDKASGRRYERLGHFQDGGDLGTAQSYVPPPRDELVTSLGAAARISVEEDGALRTSLRAALALDVPLEAELDGSARSQARARLPVAVRLTLRRGSPFLEVEVEVENRCRDHRLRMVFPTGLTGAAQGAASCPFDVVERPVAAPDCRAWKEAYYPTHPTGGFVDVSDGAAGLALFTQGLREYELGQGPDRSILLTLLRAHRESMAVHSPERREELVGAGRYCPGRLAFRCALMPHPGGWDGAGLHRRFAEFRNDPEAVQFQAGSGGTERREALRLVPEELVPSALKKCAGRASLAVRFFNPTVRELDAVVDAGGLRPRAAWLLRLDERRLRRLAVDRAGRVRLRVGGKKIVTIELVPSGARSGLEKTGRKPYARRGNEGRQP